MVLMSRKRQRSKREFKNEKRRRIVAEKNKLLTKKKERTIKTKLRKKTSGNVLQN